MTIIAGQRRREVDVLTGQVREVLATTTTRTALRSLAATVDRLAACAGGATEAWYPTQGAPGLADALEVCEGCPVRARCLALEIASVSAAVDVHGVHGGLTEREARAVFRQLHAEQAVSA